MARRRRYTPRGIPQHIVQRGNNRQVCFASDVDLGVYADSDWLLEGTRKYDVAIHGWVVATGIVSLFKKRKREYQRSIKSIR